jgi:hypothetical protein
MNFGKAFMMRILVLCSLFLSACSSMREAGQAYFISETKLKGLDSSQAVLERVNKNRRLFHIVYNNLKPERVIQCTFLRNQLYVAASKGLGGRDKDAITKAALMMEKAYQEDDQAFLSACDEIFASPLGITFAEIQRSFFYDADNHKD